jgi:hypothetical protein
MSIRTRAQSVGRYVAYESRASWKAEDYERMERGSTGRRVKNYGNTGSPRGAVCVVLRVPAALQIWRISVILYKALSEV